MGDRVIDKGHHDQKHFELAAQLIADSDNDLTARMFAALVIVRVAEQLNPRFDRARFITAGKLGDQA